MCFYKTFYVAYESTQLQKKKTRYYMTQLACDFELSCRLEAVPVVEVEPVSMDSSVIHFVDLKHISWLKHLT